MRSKLLILLYSSEGVDLYQMIMFVETTVVIEPKVLKADTICHLLQAPEKKEHILYKMCKHKKCYNSSSLFKVKVRNSDIEERCTQKIQTDVPEQLKRNQSEGRRHVITSVYPSQEEGF